jgi:hypothetical protein
MEIPEQISRQELRARLRKKTARKKRAPVEGAPSNAFSGLDLPKDSDSLLKMMTAVNQTLQQNPQMLESLSKCMKLFENTELMDNIKEHITPEIVKKANELAQPNETLEG